MMDSKRAYRAFLQVHEEMRGGERLRRLLDGHGHAEKAFALAVWWPAFHSFHGLHPEYEVVDYKDGFRYLDFAYIHASFRVAIEIDGFGPHLKQASRWQFADSLRRQNHLMMDGWYVLRFSYDDVKEHPRLCQQTLHQLFGRLLANGRASTLSELASASEREIIRLVARSARPVTPEDIVNLLKVSRVTAYRLLKKLVAQGWLQPVNGERRLRSYSLHAGRDIIRW